MKLIDSTSFVLAVVLLSLSCALRYEDKIMERITDDTDEHAMEEVPFIRVYPPPDRPPTAQIVSLVDSGEIAVDGYLYVADWDIPPDPQVHRPTTPVPWPDATYTGTPPYSIRFLTDVLPSYAMIQAFDMLDTDTGEPISQTPIAKYECSRFDDSACMTVTEEGFIQIDQIPFQVFDMPYLTLFATWSVPLSVDIRRAESLAPVTASWLFHLKDNDE